MGRGSRGVGIKSTSSGHGRKFALVETVWDLLPECFVKLVMTRLILAIGLLCTFFLEMALAKQVDLRPLQTPVKSQDNRDTCAYFAVTALIESTIKNLTGQEYDISEEYEIFRHKVLSPWRPEVEFGNTYDLLLNFSNGFFFYEEKTLPYQKSSPDFTQPFSSEQMNFFDLTKKKAPRVDYRSLRSKIISQMWVRSPWSQLFMQELDAQRPVVVTLKVSMAHINDQKGTFTYSPAIDADCAAGKIACGGHAVLLVGYDDVQKVFMFKNSWGPKWGLEGYGFVSFDHVDAYSDQPLSAYFDKLSGPWVRVLKP